MVHGLRLTCLHPDFFHCWLGSFIDIPARQCSSSTLAPLPVGALEKAIMPLQWRMPRIL
jgi:hypothetical protein